MKFIKRMPKEEVIEDDPPVIPPNRLPNAGCVLKLVRAYTPEEETYLCDQLEIEESFWANYEVADHDGCDVLDFMFGGLTEDKEFEGEGPWIIEGVFWYTVDYFGEHDCEFDWEVLLSGEDAAKVEDLYELVKVES